MEYRRMGRSGLKVSEICLGTMTFGHSVDEGEAKRIVDLALDAGVNFLITSAIVGARTTEQLRDGLGAVQWRLEGDALKRLDEVSRLPARYPKSMETPMKERRDRAIKMPSL